MIEVKGNYILKLDFGSTDVGLSFGNIKQFAIIQDMNKFLPSFRIKLIDSEGTATHVNPFDKEMTRASVQIGRSSAADDYNTFDFLVMRAQPESYFTVSVEFDIVGLLDKEGLFTPQYSRSFDGDIAGFIQQIGEEMGVDSVDVGSNLSVRDGAPVIQPNWTNAQMLSWLQSNLGDTDNTNYHIFVKQVNGRSILVCKSIQELSSGQLAYKFVVNDDPVEDYLPVFDYKIYNNYKMVGLFGATEKIYTYYDYDAGEFVEASVNLDNYQSMTDYFMIDTSDSPDNVTPFFGRNNEFTEDFKGRAQAGYHQRISELVKMWILTWGLPNAAPGDVVRIIFGQGAAQGQLFSYQYTGYWLVEKVVHIMGETHRTRLLLTRNGVDTDKGTSLLEAGRRRK